MPLHEIQAFLAQLYTSADLRASFRRAPKITLEKFGLTEEESKNLQRLDLKKVDFFADSLINKRLKLVKSAIPATCTLIKDELRSIFTAFCEEYPLSQRLTGEEDGFDFLSFLNSSCRKISKQIPYAKNIRTYDYTRLRLLTTCSGQSTQVSQQLNLTQDDNWRGRQPVIIPYLDIKQFEYPVDRIIPQLIDDKIPELKPESTWILFVRSPESQHVLTKRIKYSTQLLIGLCQNGETVGTVLDKLACTLKVPSKQQLAFETECYSFLNALAKESIVAFI